MKLNHREVHFYLAGAPSGSDVQSLRPRSGVDVASVDVAADGRSCVVVVEVPVSRSPEDAVAQAASHLQAALPSLADVPWDEEGIKVVIRD